MKINYKDLLAQIDSKPSKDELSKKLFQLGHEHKIVNDIFDMDLTPNRGDCLSVQGLLRDLSAFYNINLQREIYSKKLNNFPLNFQNYQIHSCTHISFLKVDIENEILPYKKYLSSYFDDLNFKKNNFFTDISNYISYETGQPTHCYDATSISNDLSLDFINGNYEFETLLNKKIKLKDKNLAFLDGKSIINLAGVVGGIDSSCSNETRSVIIECAYFNPEDIIGKSVKYDIQSDAAHKFERGVDPLCHDYVLRRFLKIIEDHATIKNVEIFQNEYHKYQKKLLPIEVEKINSILGIKINKNEYVNYLARIGFEISNDMIEVPSYRSDIFSQNDLAEELARFIGYDNIKAEEVNISKIKNKNNKNIKEKEQAVQSFLIDNGFFEIICNPFVSIGNKNSIKIDNPLDSNRQFLRTSLKESLINSLLYNERRQKDSIKLFEISSLYSLHDPFNLKKTLGLIVSGRVGKNYLDFSKKIDNNYIPNLIGSYIKSENLIENVPRNTLDTKLKNNIYYLEINIDDIDESIIKYQKLHKRSENYNKYEPISEFPCSSRDLSFLLKDISKLKQFEDYILSIQDKKLKEVFVFDYFYNKKTEEIKIGFRFIFQSHETTITDAQVNEILSAVINKSYQTYDAIVPGMQNGLN